MKDTLLIDTVTAIEDPKAFSDADVDHIISAIKYRRSLIAHEKTKGMRIGSTIEFVGNWGAKVTATVTKINRKTIMAREVLPVGSKGIGILWRVSPGLIKVLS